MPKTEPETQKIAVGVAEAGFRDGWSKSEWTAAIEKELNRYREGIEEIRVCDKCDLCEDHHG